ncbi:MAG: sodium ion-translocating decarboxylase subunit beta, partial [Lentisphaeria bacterium]
MNNLIRIWVAVLTLGVTAAVAHSAEETAADKTAVAQAIQPATQPADDNGTDWRHMLGRVKGLTAATGITGFLSKAAPEYLTKGYHTPTGSFVPGHDVKVIGNLPYGVGQALMVVICLGLIYLAIVKGFEPLLLLPIGFGGLLANMPYANVAAPPLVAMINGVPSIIEPGGFLFYFFDFGVSTGLFPIIIFMGVGAMTDFGPLIANPRTALLGAAAQFGIFVALLGALVLTSVTGGGANFGLR